MTLTFHLSKPHFLFKFPSFNPSNKKPIFILHYKFLLNPQNTLSSTTSFRPPCTANSPTSYSGWDWVDSAELGESNQLKKFLISLGINDKKYVFTCLLGFIIAFTISRVKVSRIIIFPAFAIVFAIGFWFGFANGGSHKELGSNGYKRRVKDESLKVYVEKLKSLNGIFDGFDVKISDLKNDIENAIEYEKIDLCDLENYVNAIESIRGVILNARNVVDDALDEVQEVRKNQNQKSTLRKEKNGKKGFTLFEFVKGFVKGDVIDGSESRRKNVVRKDGVANDVVDGSNEDTRRGEGALRTASNVDSSVPNREIFSGGRSRKINSDGLNHETKRVSWRAKRNIMEQRMNSESFLNADEYNYQNISFTSNQRFGLNMDMEKEIRNGVYDDAMSSNSEFDIYGEHMGGKASLRNQEIFQNSNGAYNSSEGRGNVDFGSLGTNVGEEWMNVEDELHYRKYQFRLKNDLSSFSSSTSSTFSDDMLFDKYLIKVNDLLKEAKECLKSRNDETLAEEKLRKSSELLHQAISLKPMSLLAIGQLGNTYLLHGELKLIISRELRILLSRSDGFGTERSNLLFLEDSIQRKDKMENRLISTCEECEALLVEAGRKYRMALSIDGKDVRALYNWGLALSFRAQLISDVGPDAALDADKLFLAAIDKFNAMMSKSNDYAPEALFRWGMALQQRSRLRPSNSRDKVKLLQQAKRLYEDAVNMGSNNLQVRKALSSCISELNVTDP